MFARGDHTCVFFIAPVDWELNGNNVCFNANILSGVSDFAGYSHWAKQKMASTILLKAPCSSGFCSNQTVYINPFFVWTQQETGDSFCAQCQAATRQHSLTHVHRHTIVCYCCFCGQEGLLSSIALAVTTLMFHLMTSITCLPPSCFLYLYLKLQSDSPDNFQPSWFQIRLFNFHSRPLILVNDLSSDFSCFG